MACDEPRFYKKSSDQHTKNACDVAYYNVLSWLTEIETGTPHTFQLIHPNSYTPTRPARGRGTTLLLYYSATLLE